MSGEQHPGRGEFRWFLDIPTRWDDNDAYGHVNNVVYYSWVDTAVNRFLVDNGLLDYQGDRVRGIVVETKCVFLKEVIYPATVSAGLRLARLGNSSVTYDVGIFRPGEDDPAAIAYLVHVYVDRDTGGTVRIPNKVREGIERILA